MPALDSKERFSDRVKNYVLFRPSYPADAIDCLVNYCALTPTSVIADIGSGTGKLAELILSRGFTVHAVEPNANMRNAAEKSLLPFSGFYSVPASAEATSLPAQSIDLITAAQAFHWFDRTACKREWQRILKPGGHVALIWNRRQKSPGFMAEYEEVIHLWCAELPNVTHNKITDAVFKEIFDGGYTLHTFPWQQTFNFAALWGRAQSSSYSPLPGHPYHEPLKNALQKLFTQYQKDGFVPFEYQTQLVLGKL
ncbi:MAG: class I SAM-dependent methyltransferase [Oscillospiraceae bacterium]|nr:class I SAM-dependent methyltransferase [Oscillospiraceae bacterium]